MPLKPIDYSQTYFYKIVCRNTDIKDCYVGHTTDFTKRKHQHKRTCYDEKDQVHYNFYLYQFIRENGGWDNFDMILLDTLNCENNLRARAIEREFIEQIKPTLNKIKRPIRTEEEAIEYRKEHYNQNKEEIKQQVRQHRVDNPEIVKATAKRSREKHKDKVNQRSREYNEKYKDKINLQRSIKINCDCGAVVSKRHIARHHQSLKHQQYLQALI